MKVHHVGIVVKSIDKVLDYYQSVLSMKIVHPAVVDPQQKAKVVMLSPENDALGSGIELIEPVGDDSPVKKQADAGGGMVHVCYEVESLEEEIQRIVDAGAILVSAPKDAPLFGGRRVAFLYLRTGDLIELVEAGDAHG